MKKAALYARVSTDGQQREGTIDSQLAELRTQVAAFSHTLIKEYIDNGFSGTLLDRPGLDQLRADAKSDVYDAIHFLDADRITRDVSYQRIIIAELLKRGKQIIIKGKNYVDLPSTHGGTNLRVANGPRPSTYQRSPSGLSSRLIALRSSSICFIA
jgi:DNA invertase Pin-like site-specific DNA recombinase